MRREAILKGVDRLPALVETPRLTLRQWTEEDAAALAEAVVASRDHLVGWVFFDDPATSEIYAERIREWRAVWEAGGDSVLGIFRDGEVIGSSGLHWRDSPDTVELGYWTHVDHIRRGYATETAGALTEAAFRVPGIEHVEIRHDKRNMASAGIPKNLGFTLVEEQAIGSPKWTGVLMVWVKHRP